MKWLTQCIDSGEESQLTTICFELKQGCLDAPYPQESPDIAFEGFNKERNFYLEGKRVTVSADNVHTEEKLTMEYNPENNNFTIITGTI